MLQHVLVGDLAPALALLALRGRLAAAVVPRAVRRLLARRPVRALLRPVPSFAVWAGALWLWHLPPAYDAALASTPVHLAQHASFVLGGLLVWNQLLDPLGRRTLGLWPSLGYALGLMAAAQLVVGFLVLSYRPLYAYPSGGGELGLSPLADQNLAGLVMTLEQLATLGTYALLRLRAHFREPVAVRESHPLGA